MDEVLVAAAAEEEYTTSLSWYAARNPEAAEDFETEIGLALKAIAAVSFVRRSTPILPLEAIPVPNHLSQYRQSKMAGCRGCTYQPQARLLGKQVGRRRSQTRPCELLGLELR